MVENHRLRCIAAESEHRQRRRADPGISIRGGTLSQPTLLLMAVLMAVESCRAHHPPFETEQVVLTATFPVLRPVLEPLLRLHPSKSRYIIASALKVLLSLGPFSCGAPVRCSAVVPSPD